MPNIRSFMNENFKMIPKYWRSSKILFGAFLLAMALTIALNVWKSLVEEYIGHEFTISFLASAWANLFFFLIIGVATFVIQFHDPAADRFEERVGYLFNRDGINQHVKEMLIEKINKEGCYIRALDVIITVTDFNEEINAYRIEVEYTAIISNATKDVTYVDNSMKVHVFAEIIENAPHGILGAISNIELRREGERGGIKILENITDLHYDKCSNFLKDDVKLMIDPDSSVELFMRYWVWGAVEKATVSEFYRHAERVNIHLRNNWSGGTAVCQSANEVQYDIEYGASPMRVDLPQGKCFDPSDGPIRVRWCAPTIVRANV